MVFCDVSTFHHEAAGGVRTYYHAKIERFAAQARHRYVLVHPGPRFARTSVAPSVDVVQVYGAPWGHTGYRVMLDYRALKALVADTRPDVLETGDPWVSGPFGLELRRAGSFHGLLSSFYHSDPVATYLEPWAGRASVGRGVRDGCVKRCEQWFYRLQRAYDCTVAASRTMCEHLRAKGLSRVLHAPFGVDPRFFEVGEARASSREVAFLYAGRLDPDKGIDLLLDVLPSLLQIPGARVAVMGRGRRAKTLAALRHPRFTFLGFVDHVDDVARVYASHDVLLAPGRHETFGLSVLEAMAAGLVAVGPAAGGTGELLHECESPLSFVPGPASAFLEAAKRAAAIDRAALSLASRVVARRYGTWAQAVDRLTHLYAAQVGGAA